MESCKSSCLGTKNTLPILLILFTSLGTAQNRKQLQGKIVVGDASPAKVLILNLNTQQEVTSNSDGSFTILAQAQDTLDFASPNLDYVRKIINPTDYNQSGFSIVLTSKQIVLDEVEIVNNQSYNAVDLGILSKPAKSYTPAERRLKTAGDFKPIHLLGLLGGSLPVDPIINAINGKTKRLKKEIQLERNQSRLARFQTIYPQDALIQDLKMNPDEVNAFTYFVLNEEEFKTHIDSGDRNKLLFYLIEKYSAFKKINHPNEK